MAPVVEEDRRLTVRALTDALHIPHESNCRILMQELGLKCVCVAWVLCIGVPKVVLHQCSHLYRYVCTSTDFFQKYRFLDFRTDFFFKETIFIGFTH